MTSLELSSLLREQLDERGWTVLELAKEAKMPYETARRAVRGIGSISLDNTNKLLTAIGCELTAEGSA